MSIANYCRQLEGIKDSATKYLVDLALGPPGTVDNDLIKEAAEQALGGLTRGLTDLIDAVCESQDIGDICDALAYISSITGALGNAIGHYLKFLPGFAAFASGLKIISFLSKGMELALERLGFCDELQSEPQANALRMPTTSPLIFDLNGDGVQTTALEQSTTFFDLNGDGFAQHTAWVSPQDGLLALDRNANGRIDDITELFGSATQDGFSQLRALDNNADGVIDELDEAFASLRVWIDANSDGISQAGELRTLLELGIRVIELGADQVDAFNAGNPVSHEGQALRDDGTSLQILDVWFRHSLVNTRINTADDFEFDPQALRLPQLIGYGEVADLRYAMSLDAGLRADVDALIREANGLTGGEFRGAFEDILLQWTGADAVAADGRGAYIDARHLVVLEQLFAQDFVQTAGTNAGTGNPGPNAAFDLEQAYQDMLERMMTRFAVQVYQAQAELAGEGLEQLQAMAASPFAGLMQIFYNQASNRINSANIDGALAAAVADLPGEDGAALAQLDLLMTALSGLRVELFDGDRDAFQVAMTAALSLIDDNALRVFALTRLTSVADLTAGTGGADDLAIAGIAYRDDDVLKQPEANVIQGKAGDDVLSGGYGADSYVFVAGDGADVVIDRGARDATVQDEWGRFVNFGGTDQLLFVGRASSEAVMTRDGDDLVIAFQDGTSDQVRVAGQFATGIEDRIESFVFADGAISDSDIDALFVLQDATGGGDAILGSSGSDEITGGAGNDVIEGRGGADIYHYAIGDGDDVIADRGFGPGDELRLDGLSAAQVAVSRDGEDAVINILDPAGGSIRLSGQFAENDDSRIETLRFADGVIWSGTDLVIQASGGLPTGPAIIGTVNGETVAGTVGNDVIDGGGGDDTLDGGGGTDVFAFGFGSGEDALTINRADRFAEATILSIDGGQGDVLLERDGDDLLVSMLQQVVQPDGSTTALRSGDSFRVSDHFADRANALDRIQFSSGDRLDFEAINEIAFPDTGTLHLAGVTFADLTFARTNAPADRTDGASVVGADLVISAGAVVIAELENQFYSFLDLNLNLVRFGVELIVLDDGTVLDRAALAAATPLTGSSFDDNGAIGPDGAAHRPLVGTEFDETISGLDGNDIIVGQAGDDIITGGRGDDRLTGDANAPVYLGAPREGSDSYYYASGDGNDLIIDYGTGGVDIDRLIFTDLARADVSLARVSPTPSSGIIGENVPLVVTVLATGETLTIANQFRDDLLGLEEIVFADGTVIERADFLSEAPLLGTSGNDFISGIGVIDPGTGNDVVQGDFTEGAISELVYRAGDGFDDLNQVDIIRLTDLLSADIRLEREYDSLLIVIAATQETIRVNLQFQPEWWVFEFPNQEFAAALTQIQFADGEIWDAARIAGEAAVTGSDFGDFIDGTDAAERIDGGGGNDFVFALGGDDTIIGGAGDDNLSGGAGNDSFLAGLAGAAGLGDGDDLIDGGGTGGGGGGEEEEEAAALAALTTGPLAQTTDNLGIDEYNAGAALAGVTIDLAAGTADGADIGHDTLISIENAVGGRGADALFGDAAGNLLAGGAGDDSLAGFGGDDTLIGGAGGDDLDGGSGSDTASYRDALAGVDVDLARGTGISGDAQGDILSGIEHLIGSNYADSLAGDGFDNRIELAGGDDIASGGGGDDEILGGGGADTLDGGAGADRLSGGSGSDQLTGGDGADILDGGGGDDLLEGGEGADIYLWTPGSGDDVIIETPAANADVDRLDLGTTMPGQVVLLRRQDDLIITNGADEQLLLRDHFASSPGAGIEEILFGDGTLWSRAQIAEETTDLGNTDPIALGEAFEGEGGTPIVITAAALLENDGDLDGDVLTIAAVDGAAHGTVALSANGDVIFTPEPGFNGEASFSYTVSDGQGGTSRVAVAIAVSSSSVILTGTNGRDQLTGTPGDDTLSGAGGNDRLTGGAGADVIDGGAGRDTAAFGESDAGVAIDLALGTAAGGHAEGDVLSGIERLSGSAFGDTLSGDGNANTIYGRGGDDELRGGGHGDWLIGGAGGDLIDGGTGRDVTSYLESDAAVAIDLAAGSAAGGYGEGDTLISIEAVAGSAFDDTLSGDANANTLDGRDGDDELHGGGGNDWLVGRQGGDLLDGGEGRDGATYNTSRSGVTVDLTSGMGSGGDAEGDYLTNIESLFGSAFDDALSGDGGTNVLVGGSGNDTLAGGGGADNLHGGAGNDELTGGTGADKFVFRPGFGSDTITDFSSQDDLMLFFGPEQSAAQLIASATQDELGTLITIAPDQTVMLLGVERTSLELNDFLII